MARRKRLAPDPYVRSLCRAKPNLLIPHYIMHSYAYYVMDEPMVSDDTFDWIVSELRTHWADLKHPHKSLLDAGLLKSGFHLRYPAIIPYALWELREVCGG